MPKLILFFNNNKFNIISWFVTTILVIGLISGALIWRQSRSLPQALAPQPTAASDENPPEVEMPALDDPKSFASIGRDIQIKTNAPADKPRYKPVEYRVTSGDSVFAIAESYKLTPETVLWANYDVLQDDPHSLKPGQVLEIPPTDGIYYQWKENDTLQSVALSFSLVTNDFHHC